MTMRPCDEPVELREITGQEHAKRAVEVAVAGGHHILLIGAPQSGKTMLARALLGLLPPLSAREAASIATQRFLEGEEEIVPTGRPCVAPRSDASRTVLYGLGGRRPRPGAVSRANRGVLLLDDLPAFGSKLGALLTVLDDRAVQLERDDGNRMLPAAFQLVATARPCPCGWFGDVEAVCTCTPTLVRRYQERLPEALRERIEVHVEVPRVAYERLTSGRMGEPSEVVADRVARARRRQTERFAEHPRCATNAEMGNEDLREHCGLDGAGHALMKAATRQLDLSVGAYQRILRLARTIADLAGAEQIGPAHLAEAVQYRARPTL